MRKTMFGGLVLAALLLAGNLTVDSVVAQTKKDNPATKRADKKVDKAGVIEITKGKDDKFRFFVRDGDGKLLAMSSPGGFATAKEAQDGVDRLKQIIAKARVEVGSKDSK